MRIKHPFLVILGALLLAAFGSAHAALTLTHAGTGGSIANPVPAMTAPEASSTGDVILISVQLNSGVSNSASVSDTLNGTYTAIGAPVVDVSNGFWSQWFYVKVIAAGTPTISATLGTNETGRLVYTRVTGFAGTPTVDSAMTGNYTVSSGTAVSFALPNTAFNNEAVLLSWKSGSTLTATPSGWTNDTYEYSMVAATSGTSAAFTGTLSASSYVDAQAIGIYDNVAACTHAGITLGGGIAIPNGLSSTGGSNGPFWVNVGSTSGNNSGYGDTHSVGWGFPDCSTISYWQPTLSAYGVN